MHFVYGTWNAPWVKHLTQECAAETFPSKVFETFNKVSWIIWKKIIAFLTQFFAAAKESQEKFRLVWDSNPWPPGCQRLFLARFLSGSWLRPTAEDVSAFGQHRKFPPRARKTSGTQGTAVQWLQRWHVGKTNMLQNVGRTTFCAYSFAFSFCPSSTWKRTWSNFFTKKAGTRSRWYHLGMCIEKWRIHEKKKRAIQWKWLHCPYLAVLEKYLLGVK